MSFPKFYIGVDLGATTVKSGVVDSEGKIVAHFKVPTEGNLGPETVINNIRLSIETLLHQVEGNSVSGIGVGAPGIVSSDGCVKSPPNLKYWDNIPLRDELQKIFNYNIAVENDANAAAIAEAKFGAGVGIRDFLFVTWGTGVGGGIIMDGKIYRGPSGGAGEFGHTTINYNGPLCNCGSRGCIESYVGQKYLSQRARLLIQKNNIPSKIEELVEGNLDVIEPHIIAKAAEVGDEIAREILEESGQLFGFALASIVNLFDIEYIIIGGGISAAPPFVFQAIEQGISSRVLKPHKFSVKVFRAALGNDAGIIGAASLVM